MFFFSSKKVGHNHFRKIAKFKKIHLKKLEILKNLDQSLHNICHSLDTLLFMNIKEEIMDRYPKIAVTVIPAFQHSFMYTVCSLVVPLFHESNVTTIHNSMVPIFVNIDNMKCGRQLYSHTVRYFNCPAEFYCFIPLKFNSSALMKDQLS